MTRPIIAASLIVKDEAESLPRCLESVRPFVDEIVVYDTGSTDGTPELAESLGARVVRGYWDDDFARARNAALDEVRATWVLQIDADETAEGDPDDLRRLLAGVRGLDAFPVLIGNVQSDGTHWRFPAHRLFRRDRARHVRPLHEQLEARTGTLVIADEPIQGFSLVHYGYLRELLGRKRGRNAAIARRAAEHAANPVERAHWTLELARATHSDGDLAAAVALAESVADAATPVGSRALGFLAYYRHLAGDDRGCLEAVESLRSSKTPRSRFSDLMAAESWFRLGDKARALQLLDHIDGPVLDVDNFELPPGRVPFLRACCLGILDRFDEAANAALLAARLGPVTNDIAYVLMRMWESAKREPRDLAAAVDGDLAQRLYERMLHLPLNRAISFLAVLAGHSDVDESLVPEVCLIAARDATLALLAEPYLAPTGASPLCMRSAERSLPMEERFEAAAMAFAVTPGEDQWRSLQERAQEVPPGEFKRALLRLDRQCPTAIPHAVIALAAGGERRHAVASVLRDLGEAEAAEGLLASA